MLPTNRGSSAYNQSYVSSSFSVVVRTRNLQCLVRIEKTLNVCKGYETVRQYREQLEGYIENEQQSCSIKSCFFLQVNTANVLSKMNSK